MFQKFGTEVNFGSKLFAAIAQTLSCLTDGATRKLHAHSFGLIYWKISSSVVKNLFNRITQQAGEYEVTFVIRVQFPLYDYLDGLHDEKDYGVTRKIAPRFKFRNVKNVLESKVCFSQKREECARI